MTTNHTISGLPLATPLAGSEVLPVVQSGTTKRATVSALRAGLATQADIAALEAQITTLEITGGGDLADRYIQNSAIAVWTITHNLGKHPSVSVVDTSGRVVDGSVRYPSLNQVEITFSAAFAGEAYLN